MQYEKQDDLERLSEIRDQLLQLWSAGSPHAQFQKTQEMFSIILNDSKFLEMAKKGYDMSQVDFLGPFEKLGIQKIVLEASVQSMEVNPAETAYMVGKTLIMGGLQQMLGLRDEEAFELAYKWFVLSASRGSFAALREISNMFALEIAKLANEMAQTSARSEIYGVMVRKGLYFESEKTAGGWGLWGRSGESEAEAAASLDEAQEEVISGFLETALKDSLFRSRSDFERTDLDFKPEVTRGSDGAGVDVAQVQVFYKSPKHLRTALYSRLDSSETGTNPLSSDASTASMDSFKFRDSQASLSQLVDRHLIYLRLAAEFGDSEAQHEVGKYYLTGIFLERDMHKAFDWLLESAGNKSIASMFDLADLTRYGLEEIGLRPSPMKAYSWMTEVEKCSGLDLSEVKEDIRKEAESG